MAQIFREENLDRISSADDLHNYMRVTSPRLWMLLSVIIALIAGFILFGSLVTMEDSVKTTAEIYVHDPSEGYSSTFNEISVEIPDSADGIVTLGMAVRVDGKDAVVKAVLNSDLTGRIADVQLVDQSVLIPEGIYDAEIVLEKISPISFLLN